MRMLVTGGAGFIGSHLVDLLIEEGHDVVVIDDLSGGFRENVNKKAEFVLGSLNDVNLVNRTMKNVDTVFHLAAYAAEGLSHFIKNFNYNNNLIGSVNLINAAVNENVEKFLFTSCHDADTKAFTKRGFKRYNEIESDDLVLTLNIKTGRVEWQKIEEVVIKEYDGKLYGFKSKRNDLLVTPNHRMLLRTTGEQFFFENAEKTFKRKSPFKIPYTGKWEGKVQKHFKLNTSIKKKEHWNKKKEPKEIPTADLFYLIGLFIADGVAEHQTKKIKTKVKSGENLNFRDSEGRFKEINLPPSKDSSCNLIRIRFCVPKDDKARKKLLDCLKRNGYEYSFNDNNDDAGIVRIGSHGLYNVFKQCGDNAHNKHIPEWMFEYSPKYLNKLLEGLIDGDGYRRSGAAVLTTVSKKLVENCIELGVKIGKPVTFAASHGVAFFKGRKIESKCFRIYFSKTKISSRPENNYVTSYKGKVWCLRVKNGNFLVEREGRVCFSGNSMAVYGTNQTPFNEDIIPNPEDSYGISKYAVERELKISNDLFGLKYVIIRPHNVYGERQNIGDPYRNVIGIFMNRIMKGLPPIIYGDGEQTRAFSYISDVAPCIAKAPFIRQAENEIVNVGAAEPYNINELSRVVLKAMNSDLKPLHAPPRYEVKHAFCTIDKSVRVLGYKTTISLEKGVTKMANWAKKVGPRTSKIWKRLEIEKNLPVFWKSLMETGELNVPTEEPAELSKPKEKKEA